MVCYLRKADMNDCDLLFEWANLPSVRQNSFSTGKIPYDEHMKWFRSVLKRDNCMQYIFMEDDMPIGQARIEINDNVAEISYSIAPERRSQGYGKRLLESLCDEAYKEFPNIKKIIGKVKPNNIASQKAFQNAGYIEKYREYEITRN